MNEKKKKKIQELSHKCNLWILAAFHTKPTGEKNLSDDLDNFNTDWIFDDINLFKYANIIKTIL